MYELHLFNYNLALQCSQRRLLKNSPIIHKTKQLLNVVVFMPYVSLEFLHYGVAAPKH